MEGAPDVVAIRSNASGHTIRSSRFIRSRSDRVVFRNGPSTGVYLCRGVLGRCFQRRSCRGAPT